jgi:signal recognition particle subunit SRP54
MGSMKSLLKMIPGMGQIFDMLEGQDQMDPEKDVRKLKAIIQSMTLDERENPDKIDRSRRNRIAQGAGADPAVVHDLLKQFKSMGGMMQQMAGMSTMEKMQAMRGMQGSLMDPNAKLSPDKLRSKRGPENRDALRDKKKNQRKQAKEQRKKNKKRR